MTLDITVNKLTDYLDEQAAAINMAVDLERKQAQQRQEQEWRAQRRLAQTRQAPPPLPKSVNPTWRHSKWNWLNLITVPFGFLFWSARKTR